MRFEVENPETDKETGRNGQKWAKQVRNSRFSTVLSQSSRGDLHEASEMMIKDPVPTSSSWKVAMYRRVVAR